MVYTKDELISSMKNEARILRHLASKVTPEMLDYRPTPKQRSTVELLQYLSMMGPVQLDLLKGGVFDMPTMQKVWTPAEAKANEMSFDETLAAIDTLPDQYADRLSSWTDAELREEIEAFGNKGSRGAMTVNLVLCAHAAYRTQLFCYLKQCGREELNTMNLWAGIDAPMTAA